MKTLIIERDSEVLAVVASEDEEKLKLHAETFEGGALSWMDFYGELGAHSERDDELGYSIHPATVI